MVRSRSYIEPIIFSLILLIVFGFFTTIGIVYVAFDKRVRIYYNITLEDPNIKYYTVFHGNGSTKLIIVFKDGNVVTKELPLDIGYHENTYWSAIALTITMGICFSFTLYSLIESIRNEIIRRRLDP